MSMPLAKALKEWETRNSLVAAEAKEILLYGGMNFETKKVFINKLDASLSSLKECQKLSLSTNQIDRMAPFSGMDKLRILSLARNALKKIERLEDVAATLEELWLGYNQIASLEGLQACGRLRVLYIGNNSIKDWSELDKISGLPELQEVVFIGNPIYEGMDKKLAKLQVLKRLPKLVKIDNEMVIDAEREAAAKL